MDLNLQDQASPPATSGATGLRQGEIPEDAAEVMFRRALDEKVIWRGKPEPFRHAASAFHTNSFAVYFLILSVIAFANDGLPSAVTVFCLGVALYAILTVLGILSARKSGYVLTNHRLMILTGLAVEKRISIPLKRIASANLRVRGKGYGDILLELNGSHQLSYLLLWPHARPFRVWNPQPLMRAVPDAAMIASHLAEACAQYAPIERTLTDVKEDSAASGSHEPEGAPA